jgi:signal transduction histidine kinase
MAPEPGTHIAIVDAQRLGQHAAALAWTLVLRPDDVVDEARGGAPVTFVGHSLLLHPEVPEAMRAAAARLLRDDGSTWLRHERVSIAVAGREMLVDLIVCHAVPLRRTNVIVRDMVLRVLDLFRLQAPGSGVEIRLEYAEGVPVSFPADGEKITWALSTLIGSALRQFQQPREAHATPRISIVVDYEYEANELVMRVADNGPGIPADRRRWLFEQNPQTGRPTGIALVVVKDVVVAHGGSIDVASKPSGGTAITLRLPHVRS